MSRRPTRRTVVAGGIAAAGLASAGVAWFVRTGEARTFVRAVLQRHLPHVEIGDADLRTLTDDYLAAALEEPERLLRNRTGGSMLVDDDARDDLPGATPGSVEWRERRVLRHFFLATDFFDDPLTPRRVSVVVSANPYDAGCLNRFARFDDD